MFCAISGSVPEEPVVSSKSGHLFEKRLVIKAIEDTGKCPVTGELLTETDLLSIKGSKAVKPRPTPAASIPGLLGLFQNEWDAVMLESHNLRQSLHTVRQELSHALYQHDAAQRVIARLIRERDHALAALANVSAHGGHDLANGKRTQDEEMEDAPAKRPRAGITPDVVEVLTATANELQRTRKGKKQAPPGLATVEELENFAQLAKQPLHATRSAGITSIAISPASATTCATAGADGNVVVFDSQAKRIMQKISGHSKKVTDVAYLDATTLVTGGVDKTVRLWGADGEGMFYEAASFTDHTGEVVGVDVHPSGKYIVSASADKTWCLYDEDMCITQVADNTMEAPYTCVRLHPDGVLLGTGTAENVCRIWEIRQATQVAKFEGHTAPITALSFSENGYYLATSAADGVKLWDLRKLKNFKSLEPYEGSVTTSLAFDSSGYYLAVGGKDARVYGVKQDWSVVTTLTDVPAKGVLSLRFGELAKSLFVGASDHNLRIFGAAE